MNGGHAPHKREAEGGFALIVVLWFLVLIAGIGAVLVVNGRNEIAVARNLKLAASAEALADAGVAQAVFNLEDTIPTKHWPLDGKPHRLLLPGGEVVIELEDENAKINPNHASDILLTALFETVGVERNRAARIGAAIADWVSAQTMSRPLDAKREQYRTAGLTYGPPGAPAESLDELQLVLGMTPEIFAAVRPYLSIFSEADKPKPDNAAPVVLEALNLAAEREKQRDAAKEKGAEQTAGPAPGGFDPDAPPMPEQPDAPDEPDPQPAAAAGEASDAVIVRAQVQARTADGGVFVRLAVLKLEPEKPKGYTPLDWRRGRLSAN